jgi:hypothetical protein
MTQFVTETQAEAILAELRPGLRDQPPIDQFRERLDATVETVFAIVQATARYPAMDKEFRQIRQCVERVKTELRAMDEISAAPEMANFRDLPKLNDTRAALVAIERGLFLSALSGRGEPPKGPAPRAWYSGFIRDLAEIANEFGTEVTTAGERRGVRKDDPYATPFTRFVLAVENLLPPSCRPTSRRRRSSAASPTRTKGQRASLAACARRIDRAIAASSDEIGEIIPRKGDPVSEVAAVVWDPADFLVDVGFRDATAL